MSKTTRFVIMTMAFLGLAFLSYSEASAAMEKHAPVVFSTGSPTGTWFPTGAGIADMTNGHYDGQPISVIPGAGGVGNPKRVGTGQAELGFSYGPFLKLAIQGGNEMYKDAMPKLRAIAAMTPNKLHLVMDKEKLVDLATLAKSKPSLRVGTGPVGSTELFSLGELFKYYGYSFKDVESWGGRVDRMNTGGRSDAWKNRQLDIAQFFINNPASRVIELMSGRPSVLVSLKDDAREALGKKWGFLKFTIPANQYPNQAKDVQTIGIPFVAFGTSDLDEEMVYIMTKSVAENHARMISSHSAFKGWKPEDMPKGLGVAIHDGAARYYKERGWIK